MGYVETMKGGEKGKKGKNHLAIRLAHVCYKVITRVCLKNIYHKHTQKRSYQEKGGTISASRTNKSYIFEIKLVQE